MKITVEFTGLAREIAGKKEIELEAAGGATYQDVMARVAADYPKLVGLLFENAEGCLLNSIVLSRNGEEMILPDQMSGRPAGGDRLIILGIIVGG